MYNMSTSEDSDTADQK